MKRSEIHELTADDIRKEIRKKLNRALRVLDEAHVSQVDHVGKMEEASKLIHDVLPMLGDLRHEFEMYAGTIDLERA